MSENTGFSFSDILTAGKEIANGVLQFKMMDRITSAQEMQAQANFYNSLNGSGPANPQLALAAAQGSDFSTFFANPFSFLANPQKTMTQNSAGWILPAVVVVAFVAVVVLVVKKL